jgi:signal transduction histidine kinase
MSLRSKIILILSIVVVAYATLDLAMLGVTVRRSFGALERQEAEEELGRALAFLEAQEQDLRTWCRSWAEMDSTLAQLAGSTPAAHGAGLGPEVLAENELDLLILCAPDGRVKWRSILDPASRQEISLAEFPREALGRVLSSLRASGGAGILQTSAGFLLVSQVDVLAPAGGQTVGLLVAGRFVDRDMLASITAQAGLDLELWRAGDRDLPERVRALSPQITGGDGPVFDAAAEDVLHVYGTIPTIDNTSPVIVRANVRRDIMEHGRSALNYALLSAPAAALVILLALLQLLERVVIRPLTRLTAHAVEVGRTDDTSTRIGSERSDEIGMLANEFDRMLEKLADSREQTIKTARMAGMSEIATGVLHNVGNVLNSVNVSANVAAKKAEKIPTRDLQMMTQVLKEQPDLGSFLTQDARGRHLLPFLTELSTAMKREQDELLHEFRTLRGGIEHIAELVRSQQTYAGTRGVFERTALAEQIDMAVKICSQAYGVPDDILVVREYEELPQVSVDRNKLIEILVNLIQNARQALLDSGRPDKRITLRLREVDGTLARIEVQDNGIGIPKENLTRIFKHGFTTKHNGHGFGLHVSANAATEMKSALYGRSDGPGKGATFCLDIPMQAAVKTQAA